jgi:hypothetical protein
MFGIEPFKGNSEYELFKRINSGKIYFPQSSHPDFAHCGSDQGNGSSVREYGGGSSSKSRDSTPPPTIPMMLRGSYSQRNLLKMKQMHKRCTSDGLGDRYYLEQINNLVNGAEAAHHSRRESATQLYNKYKPANDPFNGVKYNYSTDVCQLIHDLL